jgi:hypothetical protein
MLSICSTMRRHRQILRYSLLALLGIVGRNAQADNAVKPQMFKWELEQIYLRADFQYQNDRQSVGSPATVYTREQFIGEPVGGFNLVGSLYHPNLVQFQFNPELGSSWESTRVDPGGSASNVKFLQRYHGVVDFLDQKPYATSIFGDKDTTYRDYDFFSRVRLDSEQYGGRTGYEAGPVPFSVSVRHYDETEDNPFRPRDFWQDTLTFRAQNRRALADGYTQLNYNANDFRRHDDGFNTTYGLSQTLTLSDSEEFGRRKQARLASTLNYTSLTKTETPTSQLLAQEDLHLQHTDKVDSFYNYLFDSSTAGNSDATTHDARVGGNWQMFSDFGAGADARGDLTRATSPGNRLETRSYGVGLNGQYTPKLSTWAQLTVGDSAHVDHEDRDASGLLQNIINETHALSDGTVTLLAQPNVAAGTIHVWGDAAHSIAYFEGVDYVVIPHGTQTEIQRVPAGTIVNGATVYVDYTATLQGSAAYDTTANTANFRLSFWDGLFGIFGRWTVQGYSGGENLMLRTLDDKLVGVDSTWRWFRASAEYEAVDSNLAPYRRTYLTQSAHFQPGDKTDLSLNVDEGWTDFLDTHFRQTSYGFVTRVQQRFTRRVTGGAEGGMRFDRGDTFDRDYATCRLWLDWRVGKLSVNANYQFNNESHLADRQDSHYIYLRIRRDF